LIENFTYDLVFKNRLASWQVSGQPEYNMTYTTNGNVETKSDFTSSGNPYNYDINDKPHAVKSVTDPLQLPAEALQHISYNILNNVSEINHNEQGLRYTISYGPDEQRVKSQYWVNNVIQKTKYYIGGDYEEEINSIGETRKLHYLPGGGLYVKNQASNGVMYYVLTDYQGSWCKVVTETGASMERYNFDPWGRRRNPDNWNIYYVPASYTFDRGYTGHEMLDAFGLINMNGRVYDPIVARFLSPDNYVLSIDNSQGFNRYSYCYNNPLKFTDPSGNFVIVDSWLIGFVHGFFSTGSGRWSAAWNSANHRAGNDARIWGGLFASDPNKKFFGRVWEVLSRLTWQAPQTVLGFLYNQSVNTFTSRVEDVDYFHGATYVVGATRGGNAVTLGSYISISPISDDEQAHIRIGEGGYTTMHEYGHYLQSKKSGPLFLYKYGIPSALGDADWTEIDANTRSAAYFHKIDASFDWVQVPGDRYRMLADRVYNPRWFEYPLFITAIGIPFIAAKNWTEPW
jgi:RHS repeat-associated protein